MPDSSDFGAKGHHPTTNAALHQKHIHVWRCFWQNFLLGLSWGWLFVATNLSFVWWISVQDSCDTQVVIFILKKKRDTALHGQLTNSILSVTWNWPVQTWYHHLNWIYTVYLHVCIYIYICTHTYVVRERTWKLKTPAWKRNSIFPNLHFFGFQLEKLFQGLLLETPKLKKCHRKICVLFTWQNPTPSKSSLNSNLSHSKLHGVSSHALSCGDAPCTTSFVGQICWSSNFAGSQTTHCFGWVNWILVGGFNPSEKYKSNWKSSPNKGENKTYLSCHHLGLFFDCEHKCVTPIGAGLPLKQKKSKPLLLHPTNSWLVHSYRISMLMAYDS